MFNKSKQCISLLIGTDFVKTFVELFLVSICFTSIYSNMKEMISNMEIICSTILYMILVK